MRVFDEESLKKQLKIAEESMAVAVFKAFTLSPLSTSLKSFEEGYKAGHSAGFDAAVEWLKSKEPTYVSGFDPYDEEVKKTEVHLDKVDDKGYLKHTKPFAERKPYYTHDRSRADLENELLQLRKLQSNHNRRFQKEEFERVKELVEELKTVKVKGTPFDEDLSQYYDVNLIKELKDYNSKGYIVTETEKRLKEHFNTFMADTAVKLSTATDNKYNFLVVSELLYEVILYSFRGKPKGDFLADGDYKTIYLWGKTYGVLISNELEDYTFNFAKK